MEFVFDMPEVGSEMQLVIQYTHARQIDKILVYDVVNSLCGPT